MRIVFFGTMPFSAEILEELLKSDHEIVGVVTMPDRPKGRSGRPSATPVKELLLEKSPITILFQPEKASTDEMCSELKALEPDLFVVVGYGEIIKQKLLDVPKKGCINVHTSLLPRHRGAAPIQRAIMAGDRAIGITIMEMVRAMDAGDIFAQEGVEFPLDATFEEIEKTLVLIAKQLLLKVLSKIETGPISKQPQNPDLVTMAPKIQIEDCQIDWGRSALEIHNQVRALSPKPGAFCKVRVRGEEKRLKILRTQLAVESLNIAELDKKRANVGCFDQSLHLAEVQLEGKKRMAAKSFFLGVNDIELI